MSQHVTNGRIITARDPMDFGALKESFFPEIVKKFLKKAKKAADSIDIEKLTKENDRFQYIELPKGMTIEFLNANGVETAALEDDDVIDLVETVPASAKYKFTEQELDQMADELTNTISEKKALEDEKKKVMSGYKARFDEFDARINTLAEQRNTRFEWRDIRCKLTLDFKKGKRIYNDATTGEYVKEEDLTPADRQQKLF